MRKIQIIYIVTNDYVSYLKGFIDTLEYFAPDFKKVVTILTNKDTIKSLSVTNATFNIVKILDLLYPSFNLNKNYIVNQVIDDTCDYVFYFDADTKFIQNKAYEWDKLFSIIDEGYVLLTKHPFYAMTEEATLWNQNKHQLINNLFSPNLTEKRSWSSAYIKRETYTYVNSAFYAGRKEDIIKFNNDILDLIKLDLKRRFVPNIDRTYHIPQFIDENYFNSLVVNYSRVGYNIKCDQYSCLYGIDSLPINTIFMYQKNMEDFKTNRQ